MNVDNKTLQTQTEDSSPTTSYKTQISKNSNNNNSFLINNNEKPSNNNNNLNSNSINNNSQTANGDGDERNETDCLNQQVHKINNRKRNKKYSGYVSRKLSKGAKSGRSIFSLHRRHSSTGGAVWQTTLNTAAAMTGVGQAQTMNGNEIGDNPSRIIDDVDADLTVNNNKLIPGDIGGGGLGGNGAPPSTAATAVASAPAAGPKRPVRRGGKAQPDRPARVLFCLGLKNPLRKLCIDIVEWKYPLLENSFSLFVCASKVFIRMLLFLVYSHYELRNFP